MLHPSQISVPLLVTITTSTALTGTIDPDCNLANASVYLFSGSQDTVVVPGVVRKLEDYYRHWVPHGRLYTQYSIPAEHAFITQDFGSNCDVLGSPYMNKCGYSTAYHALNHIAGPGLTNGSGSYVNSSLRKFSQAPFVAGGVPQATGFDSEGYVYVPAACVLDVSRCRLHISFHGCKQGRTFVGDVFVVHSGMLQVAEANNFLMIFPQVIATAVPLNPNGCWDWWGLYGPDYASQIGVQMAAVHKMALAFSRYGRAPV
jgi:hypothetical protein